MEKSSSTKFGLPVGPIHPALKEPVNFMFYIEGERIVEAIPRIGYVHRGVEKLAERRTYLQTAYLVERTCGICSGVHQFTYVSCVEQLGDIKIPPRAHYIRSIILELERLHSHSLWIGLVAYEIGFETLFMYIWKDREVILDLLEAISGNRVNYGMCFIGGAREDLNKEIIDRIRKALDEVEESMTRYKTILLQDLSVKKRTENVGFLPKRTAMELGAVGPTARASGVNWDLRIDVPYSAYPEIQFNKIVLDKGDVLARVLVRVEEFFETIKILRQLIDQIPEGPIETKGKRRFPDRWSVFRSEAPRGELIYSIRGNGTDHPERVKIRTPTLANMQSIAEMLRGNFIADIPVIVAGIDPCMSCMDRVAVIDLEAKNPKKELLIFSEKELRQYAIKWYEEHYGVKPSEFQIG